MTQNVGTLDRILRAVVGLVLISLPFATGLAADNLLLGYGSVAAGVILLAVALARVCPVYMLFGLKTCA